MVFQIVGMPGFQARQVRLERVPADDLRRSKFVSCVCHKWESATRYAKAYGLIVREPPFPKVRFTNTLIGSALRANDPVIRWFCARVKEIYESVQHKALRGRGIVRNFLTAGEIS